MSECTTGLAMGTLNPIAGRRPRPAPVVATCTCGEFVIVREPSPRSRPWCAECRAFVEAVLLAPRAPANVAPSVLPPGAGRLPTEGLGLATYLDTLERSLIQQALDRTGGNKAQAAKLLGLNRTTLVEMRKRHELSALRAARAKVHP
jgi:hypothetical protein